ncbi:MAG: archaellin/type IV pilin N-terminal domain-containing protein [Nitrosopumilaceae archaeon]
MNLIQKGHRHTHRGIIGIESAIVLIAFVIVAAALAFVVLNMGFATTQKAKTTIISSLSEASSGIAVSGKVTAIANVPADNVNATAIPLKITSGGDSINLDNSTVSIKYLSNNVEYDNILRATLTGATYQNVSNAFEAAKDDVGITGINFNPVNDTIANPNTFAIIYWTVSSQNPPNAILEQGEHAVIAIGFQTLDKPVGLDKIRIEMLLSSGATMTVERNIPNLTSMITDLG